MNKKGLGLLVSISLVLTLVVAGCGTTPAPAPAPTPAPSKTAAVPTDLAGKVDALQKLMDVQTKSVNPGLGTVMIEYGQRMSKIWFSGQAKNWDQIRYQLDEMKEIQETGEVDRPARADALKAYEATYLAAIDKAALAKDAGQFDTAYKAALSGCNSCHKSAKGTNNSDNSPIPSYGFIKVQIPTSDPTNGFQDFKGN